jgi:cellulose synthase/poly-beta-1,6-N-acetylglucosamine synthase-like glycosyltransferase
LNGPLARAILTAQRPRFRLPPSPAGRHVATALERPTMPAAIWFALSALLLVVGLHPFVTYPLSLWLMRQVRRRREDVPPADPGRRSSFAICVCAYNEEATIERKVRNMLALRRRVGSLEILVYVDAATDRTAALLEPFAGEISVHVAPRRLGKTHGMNLLVERATAEIVVFSDANVLLEENAVAALAEAFQDDRTGCVCGHLIYVNAQGTPTSSVGSIYWRLEEWIKEFESGAGAVMGADGSLFAIRRQLHRPVPPNLIDDMFLSLSVLCDGYRVVRARNAIAFEESVTSPVEEFGRKIRIACQAFNVHRQLWPRLRQLPLSIVYMYVSHKLLRWLSIYSLALSGLAAAVGLSDLGVPLPVTGAVIIGLAGLLWWAGARHLPPFAQAREVLIALIGAGIGVAEAFRGKQYQTWTPASSIRHSPDSRR